MLEEICASVLSPDVQQFLANEMSALAIRQHLGHAVDDLVLNHAFSYSPLHRPGFRKRTLTESDLLASIASAAQGLGVSEETIAERIRRNLHDYRLDIVNTQTRRAPLRSADLRKRIDEFLVKYPESNVIDRPLHEPDLMAIAARMRLRIEQIPDMELLSACGVYGHGDTKVDAIFVNASAHPAVREFMIAHEIAHWWLHRESSDFLERDLRAPHSWHHLENEADKFALIVLFPTAYLTWEELSDGLGPDLVLDSFIKGMDTPFSTVRERMLSYVATRISSYHAFKDFVRLDCQRFHFEADSLQVEQLAALKDLLRSTTAWAELDDTFRIVDCSEPWAVMLGTTPRDVRDQKPDLVRDLTPNSLRPLVKKQLKAKKEGAGSTFYFTQLRRIDSGKPFPVAVRAYPIRSAHGHYSGSLGIVSEYPPRQWTGGVPRLASSIPLTIGGSVGAEAGSQRPGDPESSARLLEPLERLYEQAKRNYGASHAGDYIAVMSSGEVAFSADEETLVEDYYRLADQPVLIRRLPAA